MGRARTRWRLGDIILRSESSVVGATGTVFHGFFTDFDEKRESVYQREVSIYYNSQLTC